MPSHLITSFVKVKGKQGVQRDESEESGNRLPRPRQSSTIASSTASTTATTSNEETVTAVAVRISESKPWRKPSKPPTILFPPSQSQQKPAAHSHLDLRWQKVVLHRFATENGDVVFALGTKFASTVTRDVEDVPASEIFNYVTPTELSRFENAGYEAEAEAERVRLLTTKPRGRPRKIGREEGVIGDDGEGDEEGRLKAEKTTKALKDGGYAAFRDPGQPKKRGRPVGWRKGGGMAAPASAGVKGDVTAAAVPSFNGPQPMGGSAAVNESVMPRSSQGPRGMYSMVAASGLVNIESESESETDDQGLTTTTPRQIFDGNSSDQDASLSRERSQSLDPIEEVDYVSAPASPIRRHSSTIPNSQSSRSRESSEEPASSQPVADDEDERQRLLGLFTSTAAKTARAKAPSKPRSHVSESSVDSLLSLAKIEVPATQMPHSRRPIKPITKQPILNRVPVIDQPPQYLPTQTPPHSLKRKSITPHFPSSSKRLFRQNNTLNNKTKPTPTLKSTAAPQSPLTVRKINHTPSSRTPVPVTKRRGRPPKASVSIPASASRVPNSQPSMSESSTSRSQQAPLRAHVTALPNPTHRQQSITAFASGKTLPVHAKPTLAKPASPKAPSRMLVQSSRPKLSAEQLLTQAVRQAGKKEVITISSSSEEEEDEDEDEDERMSSSAPGKVTPQQGRGRGNAVRVANPVPPLLQRPLAVSATNSRRQDEQNDDAIVHDDDDEDFSPVRESSRPAPVVGAQGLRHASSPNTQFIDPRLVMRRRSDESSEEGESVSESEDSLIDERYIIRKK